MNQKWKQRHPQHSLFTINMTKKRKEKEMRTHVLYDRLVSVVCMCTLIKSYINT